MIDVIDLDYTLLDADDLKNDLAANLHLSREQFNNDYEQYYKKEGRNYHPFDHIKLIVERGWPKEVDKIKTTTSIRQLLLNIDHYLLPGAVELLHGLRARGDTLIIYSFGDEDFQRMKIESSKLLPKLVDGFVVEGKDKTKNPFFETLIEEKQRVLLINDNLAEAVKMKELLELNGIECEVIAPEGPYNKLLEEARLQGVTFVHKLEEVQEIINKPRQENFREFTFH
jgi:FMN phosphatase YigB (HAD superfamily)